MSVARNPQKPIRSYFNDEDMRTLNDMREKLSAETDNLVNNPASFDAIIAHIKARSDTIDSLYAYANAMYTRLFPKPTERQQLSDAFGFFSPKESPSINDLFNEMLSYVVNYYPVYMKECAAIAKEPRLQTIKFDLNLIIFSGGFELKMNQKIHIADGAKLKEEFRGKFDAEMQRLADEQKPASQITAGL